MEQSPVRHWGFGQRYWPMDYFREPAPPDLPIIFIENVMLLWRQGADTLRIAKKLKTDEHVVCSALRVGREMK